MANLGTLWFGADIDLTALKNKISQGNQSVLDALKMNYDPASYTQMVNKLKSELAKETFEIKIDTNAQQIRQQLNQSVSSISNSANAPILNMSGLSGIQKMKGSMADLTETIVLQREKVKNLWEEYKRVQQTFGKGTVQAQAAKASWKSAADSLFMMRTNAGLLGVDIKRATLSSAALKEQMKQNAEAAKQWNSDHMRLNATLAGGIHVSTQLGSALSSLFAIDAARQFLGNVIEIGGQLEKQRISIGAILGDTVKANHLFEQIKGLALKSPFGVVELDQYTKQLSAYGFKYNELYDMTKRLADISAGAGQDIGRLTLALGHVRSATYLTGITLRQFSMNNIPMLKMLAEYYTELEKRVVTTAEVQQRISKRQVSYEDVIEQIRRLTNEGGMFYNMQEKISESLAARYKNLKDAMDIMYGEMAEGFVGDALKELANILLKTTRHWKEIATVMGIAAAAFMYSKIKIGLTTVTMQGNTAATLKQIMADKQLAASQLRVAGYTRTLTAAEQAQIATSGRLTASDITMAIATKQLTKDELLNAIALKEVEKAEAQALVTTGLLTQAELDAALATDAWKLRLNTLGQSIKRAFMGIGSGTLATLGLMVGTELYMAWDQWNQRIDDKSKEMKDLIKSRIIDLQKMQKSLDETGAPKDTTELKARIQEMKQVLADSESYTKTIDEQLSKTSELPKQYEILAEAIEDVTEKSKKMLDAQDDAALLIKASKSDFKLSDWPKSLLLAATGNYSAAGSSLKKIYDQMFDEDIVTNIQDVNDAYKDLRKTLESLYEFKEPLKELINDIDIPESVRSQLEKAPFEEQLRILAENGYWDKIEEKIKNTGKNFNMTEKEIKTACEKLKSSFGNVADEWGEIADNDIKKMFDKLVEIRGGDEKEVRKWALDNIEDVRMLLDGVLDQANEKEPAIRKKFKRMFLDMLRFGVVANELKELAEGADVGASMFTTETTRKLLEEMEAANITEDTADTTDPTKGDKKDKLLKEWQERFDALKAYYDEVQKYVKLGYDVESAMQKVKELGLGDSSVFKGMDATRENYAKLLKDLREEIKKNESTIDREKLDRRIAGALGDFDRDGTKEMMDKNVSIMKDYINQIESQWKLYRDVMKKTGGNQDVAQLAFVDGRIWDDTAKILLDKFNKLGAERQIIPIEFRWDMNEAEFQEALKDIHGKTQDDLVALAMNIQKIIRGNYQNFVKETADAYGKSLSEQQKLNELIRERADLEDKLRHANTEEQRKGYTIQIEAKNREIADQQWASFKETEDWGRIFGNLDKISKPTLRNMLTKLRAIAPSLNESVEATKALYEAIDKIEQKLSQKDPFGSFARSAKKVAAYGSILPQFNGSKLDDKIHIDKQTAKRLGLGDGTIGWTGTLQELVDKANEEQALLLDNLGNVMGLVGDLTKSFRDLFHVLGQGDWADAAEGIGQVGDMVQNVMQGFASGGEAGAIIGFVTSVIDLLKNQAELQDQFITDRINKLSAWSKEFQTFQNSIQRSLERSLGSVYTLRVNDKKLDELIEKLNFIEYVKRERGKLGGVGNGISDETFAAYQRAKQTKTYYDSTYATLLAQRDLLRSQYSEESTRKNKDEEKLADYKDQINELSDQIKNFAYDMAKTLYDIDFKSWSEQLADALVSAWAAGESGAEAYKKKVSEILRDLGAKIIAERFVAKALEPIMDEFLAQYESDNGVLTEKGMAILGKMYDAGERLQEATNDFMDGINEVARQRGADLKDASSSSTSSSIKSITESTADILASYMNAIRADVSVNRAMIAQYYPQFLNAVGQVSVLSQTQVTLQTQIAANTLRNADAADKIFNLLHGIAPDGTYVRMK